MAPGDVRPRVLLVEDDEDVCQLVRQVLEDSGCFVSVASDGEAAIEALASEDRPDVLLLDLVLPRRDGWEVLDAVDTLPRPPAVVLQTAALTYGGFREALARGVRGVLPKPFSPVRLIQAVDCCMDAGLRGGVVRDRRTTGRRRLHAPVTVEHAGGPADALLVDMSAGGICVEMIEWVTPGSRVALELVGGDGPRLWGHVRWAVRPARRALHGLSFSSLCPTVRRDLEEALAARDRRSRP